MEHTPVEPAISVRIITADYYMSSPFPGLDIGYSIYRGSEIKKVPVIRVFGTTPNGKCLILFKFLFNHASNQLSVCLFSQRM